VLVLAFSVFGENFPFIILFGSTSKKIFLPGFLR